MGLLVVQDDATWFPVVRRGRFTIEKKALLNFTHFEKVFDAALKRFVADMEQQGLRFQGIQNDASGTPKVMLLDSVDADGAKPFAGNVSDRAPEMPRLGATTEQLQNYARAVSRWEAQERAATLPSGVDEKPEMVDIRVYVKFLQRTRPKGRALKQSLGILAPTG